jgi:hypothetical protein
MVYSLAGLQVERRLTDDDIERNVKWLFHRWDERVKRNRCKVYDRRRKRKSVKKIRSGSRSKKSLWHQIVPIGTSEHDMV